MRKRSFNLCQEGLPFIGFSVLVALSFAFLGWGLPTLLVLVMTFFVIHFFRDPERVISAKKGQVLSPADGKVVAVRKALEPFSKEQRLCISIFMNIFNVHVNRSPVKGKISKINYLPGLFFNASFDKASEQNERNEILIEDNNGEQWTVVQIAGLIARRIICWSEEGDFLEKGDRIGLIKFGSRVDLYLPTEYDVHVSLGQKVAAGQDILAQSSTIT